MQTRVAHRIGRSTEGVERRTSRRPTPSRRASSAASMARSDRRSRQVMRRAQQETSDRYLKWRRRSSLRTVIMHSMKNMQESMDMQSMKITKVNMIMQSMKTMKASKKDGAAMPCGPLLVQIEPKASNAL